VILYDQVVELARQDRAVALQAIALGAEGVEIPTVQSAVDDLNRTLRAPVQPSEEDQELMRLRLAIGLPAKAIGS
jgi:hypothetical protein